MSSWYRKQAGGLGAFPGNVDVAMNDVRKAADNGNIAQAYQMLTNATALSTGDSHALSRIDQTRAYVESKTPNAAGRQQQWNSDVNSLVAYNQSRLDSGQDAKEIAAEKLALKTARMSPLAYSAGLDKVPVLGSVMDKVINDDGSINIPNMGLGIVGLGALWFAFQRFKKAAKR